MTLINMDSSNQFRPTFAEINVSALTKNLNKVRAFAPNSKVLAIIKANGYGHGLACVAKYLAKADGFGVASLDEAIQLRGQGFLHPIVLLEGVFNAKELPLVASNRLDMVVHSHEQLSWLAGLEPKVQITLWIKFDTGMHRLGFDPNDIKSILLKIKSLAFNVKIVWMTHFASADSSTEFTHKQLAIFKQTVHSLNGEKSAANSAAIQKFSESHFDWVRPGIMLYGASATENLFPSLLPVMSLKSTVISLRWVAENEAVGYGNTWVAKQDTLVAVIAIGYGDGYPRHAKHGTPVLVDGQKMPLIGRVSMDMITVDVTAINESVAVGSKVELWGKNLPVDEVAKCANTIGYDLLCAVSQRVPRIEVSEDE